MKPRSLFTILALAAFAGGASAQPLKERSLDMLYRYMPMADSANYSRAFFEHNVDMSLKAREEMPWGKSVPEREFLHFVVPVRVNNEALDNHREEFYNELKDRVKGLSMKDAILEINHWCHEKVTYQPSNGRTHSPLASVSSAIGRCGEESTFGVAALRAMGIPARQVYTPRWAHTDDNHAWVEAWADGKWYFLGACEPEPILDLGWFNAPAARGMLMHARVFGPYQGTEEILSTADGITDINVTEHYAPVDTLNVTVLDASGKPIQGATVDFRIYNYAEFYPIASKVTDNNGHASLIAGKGDMILWVSHNGTYSWQKCSMGKQGEVTVKLDPDAAEITSADIDIVPPPVREATVKVTSQQRAENDRRFAIEDSIRKAYVGTFVTATDPLTTLLAQSRGNHETIAKFYNEASDKDKAFRLLKSLTEKDLTDVSREVLDDHYSATDNESTLFAEFIMSPRIANEELTPFRSQLSKLIPVDKQKRFRYNPQLWSEWVRDNIDANAYWYPVSVTMNPVEVYKLRRTSSLSRDVFFVAAARTMGIPARIDPVTGKPQWADSQGKWVDANLSTQKQNVASSQTHKLTLTYEPEGVVDDPLYYTHFTISKIENGKPKLLNYPDFIPLSKTFANSETLDEGEYMIVTGQRLADGGVLAHVETVMLDSDKTVPLVLRSDSSKVQVSGSFNSELKFTPAGSDAEQSILATTGRGYFVVALVKPGNEPSNHALRDIAALSKTLEENGTPIIILTDSKTNLDKLDNDIIATLPSTVTMGHDSTGEIAKALADAAKSDQAPVIIIADTFNRVVFSSTGYNIGLGQKITDTLRRL